MNSHAGKTTLLVLLMVWTLSGCHKKKEATLPPQSQAPTVETAEPSATTTAPKEPPAAEPTTTTTPSPSTTAEPSTAPTTATTTKPKPKPRRARNHTKPTNTTSANARAPTTTTPAPNGTTSQNSKVVVPQGGEGPTGQISAAGPDDDARSRQAIEQLLQSTDTNLRSIDRKSTRLNSSHLGI